MFMRSCPMIRVMRRRNEYMDNVRTFNYAGWKAVLGITEESK